MNSVKRFCFVFSPRAWLLLWFDFPESIILSAASNISLDLEDSVVILEIYRVFDL